MIDFYINYKFNVFFFRIRNFFAMLFHLGDHELQFQWFISHSHMLKCLWTIHWMSKPSKLNPRHVKWPVYSQAQRTAEGCTGKSICVKNKCQIIVQTVVSLQVIQVRVAHLWFKKFWPETSLVDVSYCGVRKRWVHIPVDSTVVHSWADMRAPTHSFVYPGSLRHLPLPQLFLLLSPSLRWKRCNVTF